MAKTESKVEMREYLAAHAFRQRDRRQLSQEKMAALLEINTRAYRNLESGKYTFQTRTLIRFLFLLPENERTTFLEGLYRTL